MLIAIHFLIFRGDFFIEKAEKELSERKSSPILREKYPLLTEKLKISDFTDRL